MELEKPLIAEHINKLNLGLSQKYLFGLLSGLVATGIAFVVMLSVMYQSQLLESRTQSAHQMAQLLLASMEQPLIDQDDQALRKLIDRLTEQPGITNVMLSNRDGNIRFSSLESLRNTNPLADRGEGCVSCHDKSSAERPTHMFLQDELGNEVLRSVTPVPNGDACVTCHGDSSSKPYTGMLVVDYNAGLLRREALNTTLLLMGAGVVVLFITLWGGWWFTQNMVLVPVSRLNSASSAVSQGNLRARVDIQGHDELAQLGHTFNTMAGNLQKAMQDLKTREAFQQALIDAIPDGVRVIDNNYNIIAANNAYCEQLGISPDTVLNTCCHRSSHLNDAPCIATLVTCPIRELRESPEPIKFLDRHKRTDGTEFECEVYAAPLHFRHDGSDAFFVVESIRNLEDQMHYSHEQKLADLGQLAAGVAHEIRNPLTSLQMAFSYLQKDNSDQQARSDYLELANREIQRCIAVSDRLLKLSTLPPQHTELVDLNTCTEETLSLLNFEAEQRELQIQTQLDENNPRLLATDSELRMIILNLVQNAFHALSNGGVIRITTTSEGPFVNLIVEDNGHGVFPKDVERIFDPFFSRRHDGTTGSGLGLAIAKSLVTRHGGEIHVRPSALGGARFSVALRNADWQPKEES